MRFVFSVVLFASLCLLAGNISAQQTNQEPKPAQPAATAIPRPQFLNQEYDQAQEGFFNSYWDAQQGVLLLEIPKSRLQQEFLYVHSLATGLGSNPVGLDRGQLGGQKVVHFERVGKKILLMQRNLRFRALTDNVEERKAVEQSFAQSVIWGGKLKEEGPKVLLVDITSLVMADRHDVAGKLARNGQGSFSLDKNRSAFYLPRWKAFPKNVEFEATLTFGGKKPGRYVRETTPTPDSVTVRQHHSFVELPDSDYRPRVYDVRCPSMSITFADYAAPIDKSLDQRWIMRHRLAKKEPAAAVSEPVEPIVYYVDSGAPDLIREALIEGASWWNQAFEAAGFKNAFQVKTLPADADPMDVRYNVIQWVHRSTRGWSYGGSVIDPRTGEIIKGHVSLGSLRVRQDRLLMESFPAGDPVTPPNGCACCGGGVAPGELAIAGLAQDPISVSLARIRQLSAHEVGHTLGFVHNFAASTNDRASVMDYPAPWVRLSEEGKLDFSQAYDVGIGEWDKVSVKFAYSVFGPEADEAVELDKILKEASQNGLRFISDSDARPSHAAHPYANLWDNGSDPLDEFNRMLKVRQLMLDGFDLRQVPQQLTTADIEQYLVPIYLYHRFQLQAVAKMIGGKTYQYGRIADGVRGPQSIDLKRQGEAMLAIVQTLKPSNLKLPSQVSDRIGVKPYSQLRDQETFRGGTGRVFDRYAPARTLIQMTLDELFEPKRVARMLQLPVTKDMELPAPEKIELASLSYGGILYLIVKQCASPADYEERVLANMVLAASRGSMLERDQRSDLVVATTSRGVASNREL